MKQNLCTHKQINSKNKKNNTHSLKAMSNFVIRINSNQPNFHQKLMINLIQSETDRNKECNKIPAPQSDAE